MAYLKKAQIEEFEKMLLALKGNITHSLAGTAGEVRTPDEATGYSQHQADQGTDDFDRTINLEVSSKEFALLKKIDHALDKIKEGTYGICDLTEEEIPLKRLEAIPYASMTVKAQERLEKGEL
ncbi:TraR/DksA family transcriptional regulator [Chlamydiales bacterium]|nr:TraR/DksA family transcriptional regulator [Chlamydiales bacterium]